MDEQQQYHHQQLAKHCRICGNRQQKAKSKDTTHVHDCAAHRERLLQAFGVDTSSDTADTHPAQFCHRCYCAMRRAMTDTAKGVPYTTSVTTYKWQQHSSNCKVTNTNVKQRLYNDYNRKRRIQMHHTGLPTLSGGLLRFAHKRSFHCVQIEGIDTYAGVYPWPPLVTGHFFTAVRAVRGRVPLSGPSAGMFHLQ